MRAWPALLFACSCGLDEAGLQQSSNDASTEADVVVSPDAQPDVQKEAGPPQACSVEAGACVANLPSGWELVAFDPANENPCPSNYTSAHVVWNVSTNPDSCDCGCNVQTPPACDVGTLQRYVSNDTTCNQTGVAFAVNGPGCNVLQQTGGLSAYSKSTALTPSGGACTGTAMQNLTNVSKNNATTCAVPATCEEQFCGGDVPSGFQQCIQKTGAQIQTCPAGWNNAILAGDDFTYDCSACTCDFTGTTCSAASLTFYSDDKCLTSLASLAVDGTCSADPAVGKTPAAWTYAATVNTKCNATGAKTASNVQLVNARTICCK